MKKLLIRLYCQWLVAGLTSFTRPRWPILKVMNQLHSQSTLILHTVFFTLGEQYKKEFLSVLLSNLLATKDPREIIDIQNIDFSSVYFVN